MSDVDIQIRCQRCGAQMDLRDPAPGMEWPPEQFWVCPTCGRHFWSTYPPPKPKAAEPKPAAAGAAATPGAAPKPTPEAAS